MVTPSLVSHPSAMVAMTNLWDHHHITTPGCLPQQPHTASLVPAQGLMLSPATEPLPRKIVDKIRAGQFVEMRELLADNIALLSHLDSIQGPLAIGTSRPRLREVTNLITWCYCFMGFMAVATSDKKTRDQLAYARLLIREAQRHGGQGWLDYDHAFRQQVAADPSIPWNTLNPSLQASTILGHAAPGAGSFCSLCRGVDHSRNQCALASVQQRESGPAQPLRQFPPRRRFQGDICLSWNNGACIYPGQCHYRHVCSICQLQHRAKDCPKPPDAPAYRLFPPTGPRPQLPDRMPYQAPPK